MQSWSGIKWERIWADVSNVNGREIQNDRPSLWAATMAGKNLVDCHERARKGELTTCADVSFTYKPQHIQDTKG